VTSSTQGNDGQGNDGQDNNGQDHGGWAQLPINCQSTVSDVDNGRAGRVGPCHMIFI